MVDADFGHDVDVDAFVHELLTTIKKCNWVDLKINLRLHYETKFGIHDHVNADSPFAPVAMYDAENISKWSSMRGRVRQIMSSGVLSKTNMTLAEFLTMPKSMADLFIEEAETIVSKENEAQEAANAALGLT